jgi:dolichol-phosphate mannosyltransferase
LDPRVSVVVMAYNERDNLAPVVHEIHAALARAAPASEVLIVDDGSLDGTSEEADRLALALDGVRVVHHRPNGGLGAVYRTGFAEVRGELVTFFPADGQFPATIIEDFVPRMKDTDFLLGYLPERPDSALARGLSRFEQVLYRVLFGPMPRFQGVFMFRRAVLERFTLRSSGRGWAVVLELMIRASRAGCRMVSTPTPIRPRRSGTSKVRNLRTIVSNLRQVLELRLRM